MEDVTEAEARDGLFLQTLGMMTKSWAMLDHSLDMMIAILYQRANAHSIDKKVPRTTDRKSRFFRRVLEEVEEL